MRRKLDNGMGGRDELYRSCLHEYMEQLLKTNQNIEFYIGTCRLLNVHVRVNLLYFRHVNIFIQGHTNYVK